MSSLVLLSLLALAGPSFAPPAPALPPGGPGGAQPELERHLFPPELVMRHQEAIGLTGDQREAIKKAVRDVQADFVDVQWDTQAATQRLADLVAQGRVDERAALEQATRVLELERDAKLAHLRLAIRIKNVLTEVQQEQLRDLRPAPHFFAPRSAR